MLVCVCVCVCTLLVNFYLSTYFVGEIVSRSSVHDKVQPAERPHVETGHSSGDPIRRRKLPQIPQSSETTR
jgi:hypothetical protein